MSGGRIGEALDLVIGEGQVVLRRQGHAAHEAQWDAMAGHGDCHGAAGGPCATHQCHTPSATVILFEFLGKHLEDHCRIFKNGVGELAVFGAIDDPVRIGPPTGRGDNLHIFGKRAIGTLSAERAGPAIFCLLRRALKE